MVFLLNDIYLISASESEFSSLSKSLSVHFWELFPPKKSPVKGYANIRRRQLVKLGTKDRLSRHGLCNTLLRY